MGRKGRESSPHDSINKLFPIGVDKLISYYTCYSVP